MGFDMRDVVVLLSGGLDSTVLARKALEANRLHSCLSANYGQPNLVQELGAAAKWCAREGVRHRVYSAKMFSMKLSMATGVGTPGPRVVPGRNLVLLANAVGYAAAVGAKRVWLGATADDDADYADCRYEFAQSLSAVTVETYGVQIEAPFINKTKRQVIALGRELGVDLDATWSCYEPPHGLPAKPCGECNACVLRQESM